MHKDFSVYLRAFQEDDYKIINKWRNDPEIQRLVSSHFRYVSEAIEREWVKQKMMENQKDIYLAICLLKNNQMIGYTSINNIDYINRSAEGGGILIDPKYSNGIYRYEAGILTRELVFNHLNLNRIEAKCLVEHKDTAIYMEACGYKIEGILRKVIFKDGKYHDQYIFSLLKEENDRIQQNHESSLLHIAKRIREIKRNRKK